MARKPLKPPNPKCAGRVKIKDESGEYVRDPDTGAPITRPCIRYAIDGANVCPAHGGNAPQVKAKAAIRAEVRRLGLDDATVDPGETLLQMIKQSKTRVELLAAELEQTIEEHGGLTAAMVGDSLVLDRDGHTVKVGEYIRGLYAEEARERDRCANMCVKGIAAGLAEREVRIAEREAAAFFDVIEAALAGAGVTGPAILAGRRAAAERLRLVQEST